jgi:PTH1 family peptidyl-tRNA hydrolase
LRAVLGIGNPGGKYETTRHNIGFIILDNFAEKHGLAFKPAGKLSLTAKGSLGTDDFILIKPTTYVNLSGVAAFSVLEQNKIDIEEFLVVCDDINLTLGTIRLRAKGGDGGHNGLKSIIQSFSSKDFPRLRFGIGSDFDQGELADYVLGEFTGEEIESLEKPLEFSLDLLESFIKGGYKAMMDNYSRANQKTT